MARADRYQPEAGAARGIDFPAREQCSTHCRATRVFLAQPMDKMAASQAPEVGAVSFSLAVILTETARSSPDYAIAISPAAGSRTESLTRPLTGWRFP